MSYLGFWAAGSLGGGAGAAGVAAVSVLYTLGEILYTGSGTALVAAVAPPHLLGRALARWELSAGVGRAAAPAVLTALLRSLAVLRLGLLAVGGPLGIGFAVHPESGHAAGFSPTLPDANAAPSADAGGEACRPEEGRKTHERAK
ncbi:hypothetical protein ACIRRH_16490 [Kitasatospora sp. NPDC101235]|uniref:hypothetical protein n=1 Tax=Kitasatospora sp. NPDC101235 TaxID=3364101 RepID=UPI0037FF037C